LDLILERVLPRYQRLAVIIVLVGASDVLRWLEFDAPPSAPPPVRVSDVFRCYPELPFRWRVPHLALIEVLRRARIRWLRRVQEHERACRWIARARAMRAQAAVVKTRTPDPAPMLTHFEHHLRRALERAKAHADRVVVVRQPWFDRAESPHELALMWHGGVGQVWREQVTTFYSLEVLSWLMRALDKRAEGVCQELGVEQVDLMPVVEQSARTYYDFFHATPAGARTIAAAVAAAVLHPPSRALAPAAGAPAALRAVETELEAKVS
jgi:hypothetical protein